VIFGGNFWVKSGQTLEFFFHRQWISLCRQDIDIEKPGKLELLNFQFTKETEECIEMTNCIKKNLT